MARPRPITVFVLLCIGILAVSCGSLFVRLASPSAPALAIAAYRMTFASVLLAPLLALGPGREIAAAGAREWVRLLLCATALSFHFALWISSLGYTSVASSVLLVDTTPFFIGLAMTLTGQRSGRAFWAGLAVAFAGCVVVFHGDLALSATAVKGNLLALGGAVAMAIYLLAGAQARRGLSLMAFVWPVYAGAALLLTATCIASGVQLLGFTRQAYLFLFLLALVPQCIGHTAYNWSLRWLSPGIVAIVALAEPVGASALARIFLGEGLSMLKIAGGLAILAGIYIATHRGKAG